MIVVADDRCVRRLAKFLEIEAPSQINPGHAGVCELYERVYTGMEERERESGRANREMGS